MEREHSGRKGAVMAVKSYVLIEAEVGEAKSVSNALTQLTHPEAQIVGVDTVTGPYDVICLLEADDLNKLGRCITEGIQTVSGVKRTTTCLTVQLN